MKKIRFVIIFLIMCRPLTTSAQQEKIIYPHATFWHKTEANTFINEKWGYGVDWVYRRKNEMSTGSMFNTPLRISLRPWIHYQFSKRARLSISPVGYMHTHEYIGKEADYDRLPYEEWRSTFQFFHHEKSPDGKWMHTWRYRYELRWQENPNTDQYRFFTRFRFRYRIRYLINTDDFYQNNTLYLAVSNEVGLNMGKSVVLNIFNQNRLYIGVGYRVLNAMRVEARYINRFRTRGATGYEFDNGSGFMLGLYIDEWRALGKSRMQKVRYAE